MGMVRLVIHGEFDDYEAYAAFTKRALAFVEHNEPDTLVWECFADNLTGKVVWHEVYATPDAYLTHMQNMVDEGLFDDWVRQTRVTSVTSLNRIDDDRVWQQLRSFHADFLHGLAELIR